MNTAERRATVALWSIQGIGAVTLGQVRERAGPLGELLERPVASWAPKIAWREGVLEHVLQVGTLAAAADRVERWARHWNVRVLFPGDAAFPSRLIGIPKLPAVLFARGPGNEAPPRRRIAIVGTRTLDPESLRRLRLMAWEAAQAGLGVVSGGAYGVDQAAHDGALQAKGETWAFLGSALDEVDSGQLNLVHLLWDQGGTVFSDYPPGYRAGTHSFAYRNRLISGASDAVLVYRAGLKSGALYTAAAALEQKRPLLATPGDPWNSRCKGSNLLINEGKARAHLGLTDLLEAVGLQDSLSPSRPEPVDLSELTEASKAVLQALDAGPTDFEGLLQSLPSFDAGRLSAALVELEIFGAAVHKGGRRYEKR